MTVRIAVVDPLPMFARGLATTLRDDDLSVETPDDLLTWLRQPGPAAVLLAVLHERDWTTLAEVLKIRHDAAVVAVTAEPGAPTYVRAIAVGATAVLPRDATASVVRDVVRAALSGNSTVPVEIMRAFAAGMGGSTGPLSNDEIDWLRRIAGGETVARLAQQAGYSERMMFRLLKGIYVRLGEQNRTRAIMRARDEGWL